MGGSLAGLLALSRASRRIVRVRAAGFVNPNECANGFVFYFRLQPPPSLPPFIQNLQMACGRRAEGGAREQTATGAAAAAEP